MFFFLNKLTWVLHLKQKLGDPQIQSQNQYVHLLPADYAAGNYVMLLSKLVHWVPKQIKTKP